MLFFPVCLSAFLLIGEYIPDTSVLLPHQTEVCHHHLTLLDMEQIKKKYPYLFGQHHRPPSFDGKMLPVEDCTAIALNIEPASFLLSFNEEEAPVVESDDSNVYIEQLDNGIVTPDFTFTEEESAFFVESAPQRWQHRSLIVAPYSTVLLGNGMGYKGGYISLGGVVAAEVSTLSAFTEIVGHQFFHGEQAANIGVGIRRYWSGGNVITGGNVFYDIFDAKKTFHQVGFGLEFLTSAFDLRVNTYFPLGSNIDELPDQLYIYPGGYFALNRPLKEAMSGGDIEVTLPLQRERNNSLWVPYLALGSYYYGQLTESSFVGGRFRLGFDFMRVFNTEIRASHDPVYKTIIQGVVTLTLPLEFFSKGGLGESPDSHKMFARVKREPIIAESRMQCRWTTNY